MPFPWLAALTLWTAMIGPVMVSPAMMVRSAMSEMMSPDEDVQDSRALGTTDGHMT